MALSYSSRWEIIEAVKNIAFEVKNKKIDPENINHDIINQHLCTASVS
jgi:undecaprenyl diphosphate synthase